MSHGIEKSKCRRRDTKDANSSGQHFAYLLAELVKGKRLCDKIDARIKHAVMNHSVARVPRCVKYFEIWTQFEGRFRQTSTIHVRHDDIGEQQPDFGTTFQNE